MWTRTTLGLGLLSLAVASSVLVSLGLLATVSAAPVAPHVVFGQTRTQGATILGAGLPIEARIDNIHYGQSINPQSGVATQDTRTHSTASGLNYGTAVHFQVCADDPGTGAVEGGTDNEQIFFFIDGIQA